MVRALDSNSTLSETVEMYIERMGDCVASDMTRSYLMQYILGMVSSALSAWRTFIVWRKIAKDTRTEWKISMKMTEDTYKQRKRE